MNLQARLEELTRELNVPGAAAGIATGDDVTLAATGVANLETGLTVSLGTLFAAGSITKVFTASLVMTLVDDGVLDLDAPVQKYVPEFELTDARWSSEVTVRMLLDHSCGLPGNGMFELPKGPDVIERHIVRLREFDFNSPPGEFWSYSNGGMVVAGRVVENLTGQTWDAALAERIIKPLGLFATTDTDEMILHSTAVGHVLDAEGNTLRTPRFLIDTGNGPAGATLFCDIAALVTFGRMHLRGGRAGDGTQVLSAESVAAMQTKQISLPWGAGIEAWGLGWYIRGPVLGHTGGNAGQHSVLNIVPSRHGVVAVLTNGINGAMLHAQLSTEILQQDFGVEPPAGLGEPEAGVETDLDRLTGEYVADDGRAIITSEDGALWLEQDVGANLSDELKLLHPGFPFPKSKLTPFASDDRFTSDIGLPVSFVTRPGADRPEFLYVGRIFRRR